MIFLGVDFGWSSGASGLCCLVWQQGELRLVDLRRLLDLAEVLTWIDTHLPPTQPGLVAVDAPTLIANPTGMRLCDRLAHKHFGKYHAGCYPANLGLPFAQRTVGFGLSLEQRGFRHGTTLVPQQPGRFQIEAFPHPAIVHLFGLERILKYKKGSLAERRGELTKLRDYIGDRLPQLEPSLNLADSPIGLPEIPLTGVAMKAVEDQLDSIICAYIAAHWWYWGLERNLVLGNQPEGYIIVPLPPQ
jgi:predicted RNase H-like nuclease